MSVPPPVELGPLTCPACGTVLGPYGLDAAQEAVCPGCRASLRGQVFRAWWTPVAAGVPSFQRAMDGEAVCYFHPANRAVLPCDTCGRFVCTICDLAVGSRHLCPVCLSKGLGKEKLQEIVPQRFIWSRTAFWLGLLPLILSLVLWPVLFATGGTAVIVALVGWKRPGSLVRGRQHWAAILGIVLGLIQVGVWFGFIFLIAFASRQSHSR